jgi:hypothetical protein
MSFNAYLLNWDILHSIEYQNEIAFEAFYKIIENQEKAYSINNNELKGKIEGDQYYNALPNDYQGSYFMQNYESEIHAIEEVKPFQRYSTCLSIFSFFEGKLKTICELIEKENSYKIKIKDLKGYDSILVYYNYLTKVYEIETGIEPYLNSIKDQRFVRNKIAHENGFFQEDELKKFKPTLGVVKEKYNNEYQIIITDTIYFTDLIQKMDLFLKRLLLDVDKRYSKIKGLL